MYRAGGGPFRPKPADPQTLNTPHDPFTQQQSPYAIAPPKHAPPAFTWSLPSAGDAPNNDDDDNDDASAPLLFPTRSSPARQTSIPPALAKQTSGIQWGTVSTVADKHGVAGTHDARDQSTKQPSPAAAKEPHTVGGVMSGTTHSPLAIGISSPSPPSLGGVRTDINKRSLAGDTPGVLLSAATSAATGAATGIQGTATGILGTATGTAAGTATPPTTTKPLLASPPPRPLSSISSSVFSLPGLGLPGTTQAPITAQAPSLPTLTSSGNNNNTNKNSNNYMSSNFSNNTNNSSSSNTPGTGVGVGVGVGGVVVGGVEEGQSGSLTFDHAGGSSSMSNNNSGSSMSNNNSSMNNNNSSSSTTNTTSTPHTTSQPADQDTTSSDPPPQHPPPTSTSTPLSTTKGLGIHRFLQQRVVELETALTAQQEAAAVLQTQVQEAQAALRDKEGAMEAAKQELEALRAAHRGAIEEMREEVLQEAHQRERAADKR